MKRRKYGWLIISVVALAIVVLRLTVPMYVIGSGSMHPVLPVGSVVILGPTEDLQPTDIITFQKEGDDHPTTHTFIGYDVDGSLRTKGDANPMPDIHVPPLTEADVIGTVLYAMLPLRLIGAVLLGLVGWWLLRSSDTPKEQQSSPDTTSVDAPA